jgi:hypothetical protein
MTVFKHDGDFFIELEPGDVRLLRFDLRSPCADCPFRNDLPINEGTVGTFAENIWSIIRGEFVHSCHKTDPRSDYEPAKDYRGPIQHCAGAMVMMEKSEEPSNFMLWAEAQGKMKRKRLNLGAPVDDIYTTAGRYVDFCKERAEQL